MKEQIVKKIEELEKQVEETSMLYYKLAHDITISEETLVWMDAEIETTQKFIDFLISLLVEEWFYGKTNAIVKKNARIRSYVY